MKILHSLKAVSTIELITIVILVMAALISFSGYIKNALAGRWKSVGDTFGQGRQYDSRGFGATGELGGTLDCFYDQVAGIWIDESKYQSNHCDCTLIDGKGNPLPEYAARCTTCKLNSVCSHLPP